MQFDIDLAAPFHYSVIYLTLSSLGLIACLGLLIWVFREKKAKQEIHHTIPNTPLDINMIKKKYLMRLEDLSHRVNKDAPRTNYQELSLLMRSFVAEVTGINVTKYTLKEIDRKKFPILYDMIEEFYSPEFSREGFGDPVIAIEKVRKGIEVWK